MKFLSSVFFTFFSGFHIKPTYFDCQIKNFIEPFATASNQYEFQAASSFMPLPSPENKEGIETVERSPYNLENNQNLLDKSKNDMTPQKESPIAETDSDVNKKELNEELSKESDSAVQQK